MFLLSRKYAGAALGAVATGILSGLLFPTVAPVRALGLAFPLTLVPLLAVLEQASVQGGTSTRAHIRLARNSFFRRAIPSFVLCWVSGLIFQLIAMQWQVTSIARFSGIPQVWSAAVFLGYAAVSGLQLPLVLSPFIANSARGTKRLSHPFPIWAMALVAMIIDMSLPQVWPWRLGMTAAAVPELMQWSSIFGASFLTPVVIGTAAWLARSLTGIAGGLVPFAMSLTAAGAVWGALWGLGSWRQAILESKLAPLEKNFIGWILPHRDPSLDKLIDLTRNLSVAAKDAGQKLDLVVWPLGAIPPEFMESVALQEPARRMSQDLGIPLLLAVREREGVRSEAGTLGRAGAGAFLLRPDGSRSDVTHQWNPTPFVQSFPLEEVFPWPAEAFRSHFPQFRPWLPGRNSGALPFNPDVKVGAVVSYDITSSEFVRRLVGKYEAGLLVYQADFSPLKSTGGPTLFLELARWRAVEFGRAMVVATNAGPGAAFLPTGEEIASAAGGDRPWGMASVPVFDAENFSETLYSEWGDLPLKLLGFFGLLYLVWNFWRRGR